MHMLFVGCCIAHSAFHLKNFIMLQTVFYLVFVVMFLYAFLLLFVVILSLPYTCGLSSVALCITLAVCRLLHSSFHLLFIFMLHSAFHVRCLSACFLYPPNIVRNAMKCVYFTCCVVRRELKYTCNVFYGDNTQYRE